MEGETLHGRTPLHPPAVLRTHSRRFRRGRCPHRPAVLQKHSLRCSVGADDPVRPNTASAVSFRASDRCHWRGNPFPRPQARKPSPPLCKGRWREAPEGLSLSGGAEPRPYTPSIDSVYAICAGGCTPRVFVPFPFLCLQRPLAATYLCRFAAKARFDNRLTPRVGLPKGRAAALPFGRFKGKRFLRKGGNRNPPFLKPFFGYFLSGKKVTRRRQKRKSERKTNGRDSAVRPYAHLRKHPARGKTPLSTSFFQKNVVY